MTDVVLNDGRIVRDVQPGMTREQLYALADQQNGGGQPTAPVMSDEIDITSAPRLAQSYMGIEGNAQDAPFSAKVAAGGKHAFDRAAIGLKGLFTDPTMEDRALLERGQAAVDVAGGPAAFGETATEGASLAIPGTGIAKTLRGLGSISAAPRLMRPLTSVLPTEVAGNAVTGAALTPDDRMSGALSASGGALAGDVLGRAIKFVGKGPLSGAMSPEAQQFASQGIDVPIWQMGDKDSMVGRTIRTIGERAKVLPLAGPAMRAQERNAMEQWNSAIIDRATPPKPVVDPHGKLTWQPSKINATGSEAVDALAKGFNEAYDAIYSGKNISANAINGTRSRLDDILKQVEDNAPGQANATKETWVTLNEMLQAATGRAPQGGRLSPFSPPLKYTDGRAVNQAIDYVDGRIKEAYKNGNGTLAQIFEGMSDELEGLRYRSIPQESKAAFDEVQQKYGLFKTFQRAMMSPASQTSGVATPMRVLNAVKAGDQTGGASFARGSNKLQDDAIQAQNILGSTLPDVGPGTAEKIIPFAVGAGGLAGLAAGDMGATLLLTTPQGQKLLAGQFPWQRSFGRVSDKYVIPTLRGAGASIAYDPETKKVPRTSK